MDRPWKKSERWWGKFINGKRHPSQGIRHIDISSSEFVAEHKYRKWSDYSAEFRHAVEQFDHNKMCHPEKYPLLLLSFFQGRGKANRRFLLLEVTKENNLEELFERLYYLARKNNGVTVSRHPLDEEEKDPHSGEEVAESD